MGVWKRVHDFILRHYETGAKIEEEKNWPLAQMEMTAKEEFAFPRVDILTDLALYEKRKDDVVKWYRKLTRNGLEFSESYGWGDDRNEDVVAAIGDDEPELALKFWQWRASATACRASAGGFKANCARPPRTPLWPLRRRPRQLPKPSRRSPHGGFWRRMAR